MRRENFEPRRANEILKSASVFFRQGARRQPDEVSAYIDAYRGRFGVEPICNVLGVSASAYYPRKSGATSRRVVAYEGLLGVICELHRPTGHARPGKPCAAQATTSGGTRSPGSCAGPGSEVPKDARNAGRQRRPIPCAGYRPRRAALPGLAAGRALGCGHHLPAQLVRVRFWEAIACGLSSAERLSATRYGCHPTRLIAGDGFAIRLCMVGAGAGVGVVRGHARTQEKR